MNNVIAPTAPARPFLKWAGGKTRLLPQLDPLFPKEMDLYIEPFLGGGAVFFHLKQKHPKMFGMLSDINQELIDTYSAVDTFTIELIEELQKHKNTLSHFEKVRDKMPTTYAKKGARFIYLNKTCYNGLYRVNKQGKFNVPFGRYKNPKILDTDNLIACHRSLRGTFISQAGFQTRLSLPIENEKAFIYCDPPYMPVSKTSNFTSYTSDGFDFGMQKELAEKAHVLKDKGIKIMLSNSDTPEVRALYQGFDIQEIEAPRSISCKDRKPARELVIRSYT